jgi:putative DNA primase/helicase
MAPQFQVTPLLSVDAFLSRLVIDAADPAFVGNLSKQVHLVAAKLAQGTTDSAIGRVAKLFALLQVVLGLAHKYEVIPLEIDQEWAISNCFKDWLTARGGDSLIEIKQEIDRIEHLLVTNE